MIPSDANISATSTPVPSTPLDGPVTVSAVAAASQSRIIFRPTPCQFQGHVDPHSGRTSHKLLPGHPYTHPSHLKFLETVAKMSQPRLNLIDLTLLNGYSGPAVITIVANRESFEFGAMVNRFGIALQVGWTGGIIYLFPVLEQQPTILEKSDGEPKVKSGNATRKNSGGL